MPWGRARLAQAENAGQRWRDRLRAIFGPSRAENRVARWLAGTAAAAEIALLSAYLFTHGSWPTPDVLIFALLPVALIIGRPHWFLVDWGIFLGLWLAWQALAGVVDPPVDVTNVHVSAPIEIERALFGGILPTLALQEGFFRLDRLAWYDWFFTWVHAAHFAVPIALGFIIWLRSRALFWRFAGSILVASFAGLLVYWRYPAAPPWLASDWAFFQPESVARIIAITSPRFPNEVPTGWVYQFFSNNAVAAIPSMHAALPVIVALAVWCLSPRWTPLALAYALVMNVALVYLGEHYVYDELIGTAIAVGAFALVWPLGAVAARVWARIAPRPSRWTDVHGTPVPSIHPPRWWVLVRPVLLPGVPLLLLLWFLWVPLELRPAGARGPWLAGGPLAPPVCGEYPGEVLAGAEDELAAASFPAALFITDLLRGICYVADPTFILPLYEGREVWLAQLERAAIWDAPETLGPFEEPTTVIQRGGLPATILNDPLFPGRRSYGIVVLFRGEVDVFTANDLTTAAARRALTELVRREPR